MHHPQNHFIHIGTGRNTMFQQMVLISRASIKRGKPQHLFPPIQVRILPLSKAAQSVGVGKSNHQAGMVTFSLSY